MTQEEFLQDLEHTYKTCIEISRRKNHDYGGGILPFHNFQNSTVVGVPLELGILVRIMDKISRVTTLLHSEAQVKDEKIEDTLMDLINYSAILLAYIHSRKDA